MTIIEAAKSGRRFRRYRIHRTWQERVYYLPDYDCRNLQISVKDLVADDWEVEAEENIEITKTDLYNAFSTWDATQFGSSKDMFIYIARRLGFKE